LYLQTPSAIYCSLLVILLIETRRFNSDFSGSFSKMSPRQRKSQEPSADTPAQDSSPVPQIPLQTVSQHVVHSLDHALGSSVSSPYQRLESFRRRYDALCRMMDDATCVVRHFLIVVFAVGIPVTLLSVRNVLHAGQILSPRFEQLLDYYFCRCCSC
jgi:hypothetical protein